MSDFEKFYQLHHQQNPFVLANAWNVKSAQLIEKAGFKAIGTSSGAIADSLGYADGEKIPFDELIYIVKRIKTCTNIPLSVDLERGYTDDLNKLNKNIQMILDCGVAGINLEDARGEEIFVRKLASIKKYLAKTNQQLFINARTDGFLQKLPSPLEITMRRARLYQDAGADGLFVTAVPEAGIIREITAATGLPVNVVATPNLSSIKVLSDSGVKRISMAVFLYKAAYHSMSAIAQHIVTQNSFAPLYQG